MTVTQDNLCLTLTMRRRYDCDYETVQENFQNFNAIYMQVMFKAKVATFHYFALGLVSTLLAAIFACNIVLPQWIAVVCSLIILNIVWKLYTSVHRDRSESHGINFGE